MSNGASGSVILRKPLGLFVVVLGSVALFAACGRAIRSDTAGGAGDTAGVGGMLS
jgi:hypothetical protein